MDSTTSSSDEKRRLPVMPMIPKRTKRPKKDPLPPVEMKVTSKPMDQPFVMVYLEGDSAEGCYHVLVPLAVYDAVWKPLLEPTRPPSYNDDGNPYGNHADWEAWVEKLVEMVTEHQANRLEGEVTLEVNIVRFVYRNIDA